MREGCISMNAGLIDGFRYNTWATREILELCRGLTGEQLDATIIGTHGTIIDTLRHIVASEAGYCRRLTAEEPSWDQERVNAPGFDVLAERVDELEARWTRFLSEPFDAERTFRLRWHDDVDRDVPAGVILMQALQHGIDHRSQICTILTTIGVNPPNYGSNLGLWDYAEATNRAPRRE